MNKSILILFLCILCLSVFAGCTNTDTSAEDAVQAAMENSTEHTELKPAKWVEKLKKSYLSYVTSYSISFANYFKALFRGAKKLIV